MSHDDEVDDVLASARKNPDGAPTLDELAASAHFSRFHLSRILRERLGYRLRDFLAAVRVERGIDALLAGHNVTRAQTDAGYDSASSFTRSFSRHTGMSPSSFRAQIKFLASYLMRHMGEGAEPVLALHRSFAHGVHLQEHPLTVTIDGAQPGSALFFALHHEAIVRGAPDLGVAMLGMHTYVVGEIPDGTYFPMVVEVPHAGGIRRLFDMDENRRDIIRKPVTFPLEESRSIRLTLREAVPNDPPITVALPKLFLEGMRGKGGNEKGNSGQAPDSERS